MVPFFTNTLYNYPVYISNTYHCQFKTNKRLNTHNRVDIYIYMCEAEWSKLKEVKYTRIKTGTYTGRLILRNTNFVVLYRRRQNWNTSLTHLFFSLLLHQHWHCCLMLLEYFELQKQEACKNSFWKQTWELSFGMFPNLKCSWKKVWFQWKIIRINLNFGKTVHISNNPINEVGPAIQVFQFKLTVRYSLKNWI